jgi:dTDP-4-amino-4,6-dideoxygalactose transaminase
MDAILGIAARHSMVVIEDAACALGSEYLDRRCGSIGLAGCFSFHPRKAVTTGEGGMVTTDSGHLAERMRMLRNHGGIRAGNRYRFDSPGYNYRLSDILAAVGVAQMRRLDDVISEKRRLASVYKTLLADRDDIKLPVEPSGYRHVYQSFVVMLDETVDRDRVIAEMSESGIETTLGTYALHAEPFFRASLGYQPGDLPQSYRSYRRTLTLPLYPGLSADQQERVASGLVACLSTSGVRAAT